MPTLGMRSSVNKKERKDVGGNGPQPTDLPEPKLSYLSRGFLIINNVYLTWSRTTTTNKNICNKKGKKICMW